MTDLTPRDVAADLQLSHWTVLDYLRRGDLPGYQTTKGGQWRVRPDDLDAWKRSRAEAPRPADPNRIEPRTPRSRAALRRKARR